VPVTKSNIEGAFVSLSRRSKRSRISLRGWRVIAEKAIATGRNIRSLCNKIEIGISQGTPVLELIQSLTFSSNHQPPDASCRFAAKFWGLAVGRLLLAISPGRLQRRAKHSLVSKPKINLSASRSTPSAFCGHEHVWFRIAEPFLFFRRQLHHSPFRIWIAQCSEDRSSHSEIRMIHMRSFDGPWETESDSSKVFCSHTRFVD
jgi:hypothetical protein